MVPSAVHRLNIFKIHQEYHWVTLGLKLTCTFTGTDSRAVTSKEADNQSTGDFLSARNMWKKNLRRSTVSEMISACQDCG